MAQFDQGGGCACGLVKVCDCDSNLQADGTEARKMKPSHSPKALSPSSLQDDIEAVNIIANTAKQMLAISHPNIEEMTREFLRRSLEDVIKRLG